MNTVAIVGRPNVGKSTLFNALIKKRLAITHEQAGVTRDIKKYVTEYEGFEITFLDTGGITDEGIFAKQISALSFDAIAQADLIMLLVSATEITPEDEELINIIRQIKTKKILVVNKADNEEREWVATEYYKFGLGEPIMISALHRKNFDVLWDTLLRNLNIDIDGIRAERAVVAEQAKTDPFFHLEHDNQESNDTEYNIDSDKLQNTVQPSEIRLLIMGKPNTGKSSLLNAFLGADRSLVSDIAGTTRDIVEEHVELLGQKFQLIDTAGIRRKNKIYDDVEYYSSHRAISAIDESDVVILLIDVLDGLSEQDKKLASLVIRKGRGIVIALNKWDLIDIKENRLRAEKDRLSFLVPQLQYAPVCAISATEKKGLPELINSVKLLYDQLYTHINTSLLNRDLQKWIERNPPRYTKKGKMKRRQGKIKFIVQTSINPVCFQIKVNNPDLFDESYKQYIINNLRKQYDMSNIPIRVDLITNK